MRLRLSLLVAAALILSGCDGRGQAETIAHPDRQAARIEYFVRAPSGRGPWPTVIFLHGHQAMSSRSGGKVFVDWGVLDRFAASGYLAVAVSLPGYGGSTGPEDFAGPFTQHAVTAVIESLARSGRAAPRKVVIEGISLGAVTAALVAADRRETAGLVLISGLYDLPPFFAHPKSAGAMAVRSALFNQTGGSATALQARSALPKAARIKAATFILNGGQDDRTDPAQARRFAEAIREHGGQAKVHIYPEFGHQIPIRARDAEIDAFIAATLRPGSQ